MIHSGHYAQFITITCLNWLPVLQKNYHKEIVCEALQRRVQLQQVSVYAFVIMPNHMHFIWQLHDGINQSDFQRDFLKFTARSILKFMQMNDDILLNKLKVNDADRQYQVWERSSFSAELITEQFFYQKFDYIHNNAIQEKWRLAKYPETYYYSSAKFYKTGIKEFDWLQDFRD